MAAAPELSFLETDIQELARLHEVDVVPHQGSAAVRVPLSVAAGRADFSPQFALEYSSSGANSPFGVGWSLSGLLMVSRTTMRGFPTYDPTDSYVFSGAGELVPALEEHGSTWRQRVDDRGTHWVRYYRARVENQIRVEQWVEKATGHVHWRTRDARNVVTVYGLEGNRIADPADPARTFAWLAAAQFDPLGNAIVFEYAKENLDGVDLGRPAEHRQMKGVGAAGGSLAQRYLKRVRYGNTLPLRADQPIPPDNEWRFDIVFDYGDHADPVAPSVAPDQPWPVRLDAHSTFAPGFEVRTYRLCRRVLCFHGFSELGSEPVLVSSYTLGIAESAAGSVIDSILYSGHRRDAVAGPIRTRSLPPLKFAYTQPAVARAFQRAPLEAEVKCAGWSREPIPLGRSVW